MINFRTGKLEDIVVGDALSPSQEESASELKREAETLNAQAESQKFV